MNKDFRIGKTGKFVDNQNYVAHYNNMLQIKP